MREQGFLPEAGSARYPALARLPGTGRLRLSMCLVTAVGTPADAYRHSVPCCPDGRL